MAEVKPRNPVPRKHHHSSRKAEFPSQTGRSSCAHRGQGVSNWLDSKGKKRALLGHGSIIQRKRSAESALTCKDTIVLEKSSSRQPDVQGLSVCPEAGVEHEV